MTGLWASLVAKVGKVAAWIIAGAVALALLWGVMQVKSCRDAAQQAGQHRVDQGQLGALANSSADSSATQGNVASNAAASEDLSRSNEQDIRHAQGADQIITPASRDSGFASLCKRASFRNNPANRVRCAPPAVVAGASPRP